MPKKMISWTLFPFLYLLAATASAQTEMSASKLSSKGEEAMLAGQYTTAVDYLRKATELEPNNASTHFKLFRVHQRMKKFADALQDLNKALELKPDSQSFRLQKVKLLKALGQCDQAVEELPALEGQEELKAEVESCAAAIASAQQAAFEQDWETAAGYLETAMRHVEQASDLSFQRAEALFHMNDYYGTISDLGRVLKAHSNHIEAYELRGRAYLKLGDHPTAITHFREALKLDPEHKGCKKWHKFVKGIEKKNKRGDDAFAKGEYKDAISHWWSAINTDPEHLAFFRPTLLKIVKAHTKLGEHDMAIFEADKHVQNRETVEGLHALGDAQTAAEKFDEALRSFRRAAEIAVSTRFVNQVIVIRTPVHHTLPGFRSFVTFPPQTTTHATQLNSHRFLSTRS